MCPVLREAGSGWPGRGMLDLISQGTEPSQRPGPCDPSLLVLSLPQEQGMKVNSSKELSMCFTEVSGGRVGSAGDWPQGSVCR